MKNSVMKAVFQTCIGLTLYPATAVFAADPGAADTEGPEHSFALGGYFSRGKYGFDSDTDIVFVPLEYEVASFPWRLSISAPYLSIDGQSGIIPQTGNVRPAPARGQRPLPPRPAPGAVPDSTRESGLGDISLKAAWQPEALLFDRAYMEFSLQLKAPTADADKGLGTGETDYSLQWDLFNTIDSNSWFATLGYTSRGKTPLYDLQNSVYFSLGAMHQLSTASSLGISFDYSQAASVDADDLQEIMPFLTWSASERVSYMLYSVFGMTDSSADTSIGFRINWTLP